MGGTSFEPFLSITESLKIVIYGWTDFYRHNIFNLLNRIGSTHEHVREQKRSGIIINSVLVYLIK